MEARTMERVRNAHSAQIDDIAPGAVGEVDVSRSGVRVLLAAGLLVPVPASTPAAVEVPLPPPPPPVAEVSEEPPAPAAEAPSVPVAAPDAPKAVPPPPSPQKPATRQRARTGG